MISCVKNLRIFASCFILLAFAIRPAHAQKNDPPSRQFGLGVYAISTSLPSGLEGTYAINSNMHVGAGLSLGITNTSGVSATTILFSPFFRYLFNSMVSPFVQGGPMVLYNSGATYNGFSTPSSTKTGIFLGGGVAYYLNHEIGVTAGVDIVNAFFGSNSSTTFGWSIVRVSADWFF